MNILTTLEKLLNILYHSYVPLLGVYMFIFAEYNEKIISLLEKDISGAKEYTISFTSIVFVIVSLSIIALGIILCRFQKYIRNRTKFSSIGNILGSDGHFLAFDMYILMHVPYALTYATPAYFYCYVVDYYLPITLVCYFIVRHKIVFGNKHIIHLVWFLILVTAFYYIELAIADAVSLPDTVILNIAMTVSGVLILLLPYSFYNYFCLSDSLKKIRRNHTA